MIQLNQVAFGYKERLFNQLNLNLQQGHICGILGKNGAGKTTLFKLIAGLQQPIEGECQIFDYEASSRPSALLAKIFLLPEEFSVQQLSIAQYCALYSPFYPNFSQDCFDSALKEFELQDKLMLDELSHGNKKKAMLSFAFATQCELILLDEPTNGLDIPSKQQFRKTLAGSLNPNQTILISTHQVADIDTSIDTLVVVNEGKIVLNQPIEALTQKLSFEYNLQELDSHCLYAEKRLNHYAAISQAQDNTGALDIELLFNALVSDDMRVQAYFSGAEIHA